eukprot:gene2120-2077_t
MDGEDRLRQAVTPLAFSLERPTVHKARPLGTQIKLRCFPQRLPLHGADGAGDADAEPPPSPPSPLPAAGAFWTGA